MRKFTEFTRISTAALINFFVQKCGAYLRAELNTIVIPLSTVFTRISAAALINSPRAALTRGITVIGNLRVYYIQGKLLLHLGLYYIQDKMLLHLGLYYIQGRLLHLGPLQQSPLRSSNVFLNKYSRAQHSWKAAFYLFFILQIVYNVFLFEF